MLLFLRSARGRRKAGEKFFDTFDTAVENEKEEDEQTGSRHHTLAAVAVGEERKVMAVSVSLKGE